MFLCKTCSNLEELALAPTGTRNFHEVEPEERVCFSCLGLLQTFSSQQFVESLCNLIAEQKFEHKYVRSSLLLPSCLYLRQHILIKKSLASSGMAGMDLRVCLLRRMSYLKAAWRELCVPYIEKTLGISHLDGDGSSNKTPYFDVLLSFDYAYNDLECSPLHEYFPQRLQHVKPLKRPVEEYKNALPVQLTKNLKPSQFTLLSVMDAICCIPLDKMSQYLENVEKELESHPAVALSLQMNPTFGSQSIYVYGRYRKMCRDLPQSAWCSDDADADDGVQIDPAEGVGTYIGAGHFKTSIEQLLGEPLIKCSGAQNCRFSAAGREDVDVRMLGTGRPFAIQLINPKVPCILPLIDEAKLNAEVRGRVEVFELEETLSKFPLDVLKQGEGQKEKEYTAVCFVRKSIVDLPNIETICEKLNLVPCPIALNQRTPIRVLHRRSPVVRIRHIMKMTATPFPNTQAALAFTLRLRTEAGTYVKEFIHSDLGRTVPNIGLLISQSVTNSDGIDSKLLCDCDIVTLDVTDISELKTPVPSKL